MTRGQRIARRALCAPIRGYKKYISPALGARCRFTPTCSAYAIEAIETHGCVKGLILTIWRLMRCQPLGRWGFDPVPEVGHWKNPRRILHPARVFSTNKPKNVENKAGKD
jgi:hypothetical protein